MRAESNNNKNQGLPLKSSKSDFCKIHMCTYEYNDQKTENIVESLSDVTHTPKGDARTEIEPSDDERVNNASPRETKLI